MAVVAVSPDGTDSRAGHNTVFNAGFEAVTTFLAPTASENPIEAVALGTAGGGDVSEPGLNSPAASVPIRSSTTTVAPDGAVVARLRAFVPSLITIEEPVDELGFRLRDGNLFNRVTFDSGVDLSGADTVLAISGEFEVGQS
jgi:hypothetical protein